MLSLFSVAMSTFLEEPYHLLDGNKQVASEGKVEGEEEAVLVEGLRGRDVEAREDLATVEKPLRVVALHRVALIVEPLWLIVVSLVLQFFQQQLEHISRVFSGVLGAVASIEVGADMRIAFSHTWIFMHGLKGGKGQEGDLLSDGKALATRSDHDVHVDVVIMIREANGDEHGCFVFVEEDSFVGDDSPIKIYICALYVIIDLLKSVENLGFRRCTFITIFARFLLLPQFLSCPRGMDCLGKSREVGPLQRICALCMIFLINPPFHLFIKLFVELLLVFRQ